jgi:hypothetical protein
MNQIKYLTELKTVDDFDRWRRAVAGQPLDLERGNPPSGYFRRFADQFRIEAIAVWREDDKPMCWRNVYGDGSKMDADDIDMLFADKNILAVPYDVFQAVTEGGAAWPVIYQVKLRTKDMTAGVRWTKEWAAEQLLAAKVMAEPAPETISAEESPPAAGHNNPPALDAELAAKIVTKGKELGKTLEEWGGAPRNQAEADLVGVYANAFKDFENRATDAHKAEKEPFLKAGKEVDAKWFTPVRDKAIAFRAKALEIVRAFAKSEDSRKAEEAARVNAENRRRAEAEAKISGEPVATIEEVKPEATKISTLRGPSPKTKDWVMTDPAAVFAYFQTLPNGLLFEVREVLEKTGKKVCKATKAAIPGFEWRDL